MYISGLRWLLWLGLIGGAIGKIADYFDNTYFEYYDDDESIMAYAFVVKKIAWQKTAEVGRRRSVRRLM